METFACITSGVALWDSTVTCCQRMAHSGRWQSLLARSLRMATCLRYCHSSACRNLPEAAGFAATSTHQPLRLSLRDVFVSVKRMVLLERNEARPQECFSKVQSMDLRPPNFGRPGDEERHSGS